MAKAKETAKGNVKLTLTPDEARHIRDVMSCVGGCGPRWSIIDALNSVGYVYRTAFDSGVSGTIVCTKEY